MSTRIARNVRIYSRHEWRALGHRAAMNPGNVPREAFIHYDSTPNAERIRSKDAQIKAMREIQRYHQHNNGWSDIGYHFVIFQRYGLVPTTRIFTARPVGYVPAAQLGHNTNTLAIQVYAGPGDKLKPETQKAIVALLKRYPGLRTLGGHRDVVATACPGDEIYRHIPDLARRAGLHVYRR